MEGYTVKKVGITVIRKEFYPEFAENYITDGKEIGHCPILNVGDYFLFEGRAEMPDGFCPWAWIDIYRGVNALSAGASFTPWNKQEGMQILCCTDGIRPVVFRVEALKS